MSRFERVGNEVMWRFMASGNKVGGPLGLKLTILKSDWFDSESFKYGRWSQTLEGSQVKSSQVKLGCIMYEAVTMESQTRLDKA